MTTELFFIIILAVFVFVLIGVNLHLARTIEQLRQYISELERALKEYNIKSIKSLIKKGGVTNK